VYVTPGATGESDRRVTIPSPAGARARSGMSETAEDPGWASATPVGRGSIGDDAYAGATEPKTTVVTTKPPTTPVRRRGLPAERVRWGRINAWRSGADFSTGTSWAGHHTATPLSQGPYVAENRRAEGERSTDW
jgi:hypothetical protein